MSVAPSAANVHIDLPCLDQRATQKDGAVQFGLLGRKPVRARSTPARPECVPALSTVASLRPQIAPVEQFSPCGAVFRRRKTGIRSFARCARGTGAASLRGHSGALPSHPVSRRCPICRHDGVTYQGASQGVTLDLLFAFIGVASNWQQESQNTRQTCLLAHKMRCACKAAPDPARIA